MLTSYSKSISKFIFTSFWIFLATFKISIPFAFPLLIKTGKVDYNVLEKELPYSRNWIKLKIAAMRVRIKKGFKKGTANYPEKVK